MGNSITIRLDIEPSRATHQAALRVMRRKGGGFFVGKYEKSAAKQWSRKVAELIRPFKPDKPIEGPVKAVIAWTFPYPKGTPSKRLLERSWRCSRPDLDNMEKGILDILVDEGFMLDDSQVAAKHTMKFNGVDPFVYIHLEPLDIEAESYFPLHLAP